nr:hypothetical protein CFP56_64627 [Quercus suber]
MPPVSLPGSSATYPTTYNTILPSRMSNRDSAQAPEAVVFPTREDSKSPVPPTEAPIAQVDSQHGPERISEGIPDTDSVVVPASPPRLLEPRGLGTSHAQRASLLPKHQSSNASRFSFQFGGSAPEEEALEEKHRKSARLSQKVDRSTNLPKHRDDADDDEDDDFFDEDAMDDMDEMEIQEQKASSALMPAALTLQQARQQLQAPSSSSESGDDERRGSDATDGEDITYADHPAYRAYAAMNSNVTGSPLHSRGSSLNYGAWRDNDILRYIDGYSSHHLRDLSEASALTVNTNVVQSPSQETHSSQLSPTGKPEEPALAARNSSHSQRTGSSLSAVPTEVPEKRESLLSSLSFVSAETSKPSRPRISSQASVIQDVKPEAALDVRSSARSRDLALSVLEELNFGDGPDLSIAGSRSLSPEQPRNVNRRTKDSETIPDWRSATSHPYSSGDNSSGRNTQSPGISAPDRSSQQSNMHMGAAEKSIRVQRESKDHVQVSTPGGEDDMYFDDGGFEQDIKTKPSPRTALDEESLDSEIFQRGNHGSRQGYGHQRDISGATVTSVSGDGPYPSFAMGANPAKAFQRQSQLLLQDLPLQEAPLEAKLVPQRNPSEDAKRSGLGDRVPPFTLEQGDRDATVHLQSNLQAYHAALANAANRAAADGRFSRMPSGASSVAQSVSVTSTVGEGDNKQLSTGDLSHYSRDEEGNLHPDAAPPHGLGLSHGSFGGPEEGIRMADGTRFDNGLSYTPPKMSFDFGFRGDFDVDQTFNDTPGMHDDFETDDDVIAAANAEALANDDEGFYGHEFGFYAKARSNSNDLEAINGGFFGEDGDNGLMRNKSVLEPNLTPITERSEFSTRNSFIGLNHGSLFGPPSAGPLSAGFFGPGSPALSRFPVTPLLENEVTSFDQLRILRADAFGGSNASSGSESKGTPPNPYNPNAPQSTRSSGATPSYFNSPTTAHFNMDSPGSTLGPVNKSSTSNHSPQSSISSAQQAGSDLIPSDADATPRKPAPAPLTPSTGAKHSRKISDSVAYVHENDPTGSGPPRWVLERRRTSEQGLSELVGREVVQNGWI